MEACCCVGAVLPARLFLLTHVCSCQVGCQHTAPAAATPSSSCSTCRLSNDSAHVSTLQHESLPLLPLPPLTSNDSQTLASLPLPHDRCLYSNWPGITCRAQAYSGTAADGDITILDLTSLNLAYPTSGPELSAIISAILPLENLQGLRVANMQLAGAIPTALAGFEMLQYLDLSGNPGLSGTLPEPLGGLTSLVLFDISSCSGIGGSLPALYAAMASLQSFDASNCGQLDSSIPPSWVLLKNLRSLKISNSRVNGSLPDWVDVAYLRTAGLAVARAADKTARRSAGAAANPSERKVTAKAAKRAAASMAAAAAGDVKGWSKLEVLLLPNNRLEGSVPLSYSNLVNLKALDLSGNGLLLGPLPSLGKLELLQVRKMLCVCCFTV